MSRVDVLGGRSNSTRTEPIASSPTQYPTYLGTTYFPTYSWPTYAPIAARSKEIEIETKKYTQHKRKHIRHKDEEHIVATSHPSTSPTVTIAPTIGATIKNKTLPLNLTEAPTIKDQNHGDTLPSPSTSRPSIHRQEKSKVATTTLPTSKVTLQETNTPTQPPTIRPARRSVDMPSPSPIRPVSSSKRWTGPSRGRPFTQEHTPDPTVMEEQNSSLEPTDSPTSSAPVTTQEPSNLLTQVTGDEISVKAQDIDGVEPDETLKVNLTFRVKENPNHTSNGEKRYKIYGYGQEDDKFSSAPTPFPASSTYKPTLFPTYSPTKKNAGDGPIPTLWPSYLPTPENNKNTNFRSNDLSESMYQKRTCPGYPSGLDPTTQVQEQEVIFAYGIQTTDGLLGQSIEKSTKMLQLWILEDVTRNLLHCPDDVGSISGRFILDTQYDGFENAVSSVYYMENDSVTSFSKFDDRSFVICDKIAHYFVPLSPFAIV
jgi:hypothetical protein